MARRATSPRWASALLVALVLAPLSAAASSILTAPRHPHRKSAPLAVVEVEWQRRLVERGLLEYEPRELAGPTVAENGDLFVGTRDAVLRAMTKEGRELWFAKLPAQATGAPLATEDLLLVGAADGRLHAFDLFKGSTVWDQELGGEVLSKPVRVEERLFVGTDHDAVHALALATGEPAWVYRRDTLSKLSIRGGTGVASGGGRLYAGFSDGLVVALDPGEGRLLWQSSLAPGPATQFPDADATPIYRNETVFVASFSDGVYALDAATGATRWRAALRGVTGMTLDNEILFVAGAGAARALHAGTGRVLWSIALGETAAAGDPVIVDRVIAFPTGRGLLLADRATGRPLTTFNPGSGFASAPAINGKQLYVLSNLGNLYGLREHLGER